ncbi:fimbrial protein [Cronobacter turicensis]|uniref:fimbrial protein n=1 Tax=Cronobacter universalis TaxID=535744 RepID=UPI0024AFE0F2|nr:fimbrial protein [Cronobacter universalis]ELY7392777.1 fimbrial protein [Cronobacter universalis]MDI7660997.1 type 1 fimbrial protein [Cronobacter universalis]
MKKSCSCLVIAIGFLCLSAHAEDSEKDAPAILNVTGTLTQNAEAACSVYLSQDTLQVTEKMSEVINQGANNYALYGATMTINVTGGATCGSLMDEGKIVYRFTGTADNAAGTALANADRSATAAKGLGIGIYKMDFSPLKVNVDTLEASPKGNRINFTMVKLAGQEAVAGNLESNVTIQIERL